MDLYLGLDGGGTRTRVLVGGRTGQPIGQFQGGGSSLSRRSEAEVRAELDRLLDEALSALEWPRSACVAACAGFASAGQNSAVYEAMLRGLLPRARVRILTDAELAWHAATSGQDGMVVLAGTGSIVWGRYHGRTARIGGAGPGNDPGSADWIGRQAVAAGLAPAPADGNFAGLLPALAIHPSAAATVIFCQAGQALAAQLEACATELGWPAPVAFAMGGLIENVPAAAEALRAAWPHSLEFSMTQPVEAALQMARALAAAS